MSPTGGPGPWGPAVTPAEPLRRGPGPTAPPARRPGPVDITGRWLLAPAPAERLAAARVLIGGFGLAYLLVRLPHLADLAALPPDRWLPVGVLRGLGARPPVPVAVAVLAVTLLAGAGAVVGWRWRLCGPILAVGTLLTTTWGASFGHALHTENLLVLHLGVLALSPAADAWSVDAGATRRRQPRGVRRRRPDPPDPGRRPPGPADLGPAARYGFPLRLAALITALTYLVAGWSKLRNGGTSWLGGDVLRQQVAYDNLRKVVLGDPWSPLGAWLVGRAWVWPPLAWVTLAVELAAPLALLRRRWSYLWAAAAWLFHLGTLALMAILFPYPLSGVAFAPLLPLERPARRIGHRLAPVVARFRSRPEPQPPGFDPPPDAPPTARPNARTGPAPARPPSTATGAAPAAGPGAGTSTSTGTGTGTG